MANTYTDGTGVLVFDGLPQPTAALMSLIPWADFSCVEADEDGHTHILLTVSDDEGRVPQWREVANSVASDDSDVPAILTGWLQENGVGAEDAQRLTHGIDYSGDTDIDFTELAKMAFALPDHNLVGVRLQSGYHADRLLLWEFGGYSECATRNGVAITMRSYGAVEMARKVQRGEHVEAFRGHVQSLLDGIANPIIRNEVALAIAETAGRMA